jgi:hypothetical protein
MLDELALTLGNTASVAMWQRWSHLLFGNAIIGVIEGVLLAHLLQRPPIRMSLLLIGANYISALVAAIAFGIFETTGVVGHFWRPGLYDYQWWFVGALALSVAASIVIEWAVAAPVMLGPSALRRRTFGAFVAVNLLTGVACIAGPFMAISEIRVASTVSVTRDRSWAPRGGFWVYYLDVQNDALMRMRPDGGKKEVVMRIEVESTTTMWVSAYRDDANDHGPFPMYIGVASAAGYATESGVSAGRESAFVQYEWDDGAPFLNLAPAADLRGPNHDSEWRLESHDNGGVEVFGPNERYSVTFTTALATWKGRNPSILPDDIGIFELGGQICALDLSGRRLTRLGFGHAPVVVRDEAPPTEPRNAAIDAGGLE